MIEVRLKRPKFLSFSKKIANEKQVSFFCPRCNRIVTHMLSEFTPVHCPVCGSLLPNIKRLMDHETSRAGWHFGGPLN